MLGLVFRIFYIFISLSLLPSPLWTSLVAFFPHFPCPYFDIYLNRTAFLTHFPAPRIISFPPPPVLLPDHTFLNQNLLLLFFSPVKTSPSVTFCHVDVFHTSSEGKGFWRWPRFPGEIIFPLTSQPGFSTLGFQLWTMHRIITTHLLLLPQQSEVHGASHPLATLPLSYPLRISQFPALPQYPFNTDFQCLLTCCSLHVTWNHIELAALHFGIWFYVLLLNGFMFLYYFFSSA